MRRRPTVNAPKKGIKSINVIRNPARMDLRKIAIMAGVTD
jgi:hypothetical protein